MAENKIEAILEDAGGFTPTPVDEAVGRAAWERYTGERADVDEAEVEAEPVAVAEPVKPAAAAKPTIAESDAALLRASGWSDEDIKGLSPEAAARHALRESGRSEPAKAQRTEEPSDPDGIEAMLTEEFSAKTAKKLAPLLRGVAERQAALSRSVREQTLDGLRERYQGQYPELARPEVQKALLTIVGESPTKDQYERGLRVLYGTRQTPEERREARAQVDGQVGFGGRGPAPSKDPEAAKRAAWSEYQRNRNVDAAIQTRRRLSN